MDFYISSLEAIQNNHSKFIHDPAECGSVMVRGAHNSFVLQQIGLVQGTQISGLTWQSWIVAKQTQILFGDLKAALQSPNFISLFDAISMN